MDDLNFVEINSMLTEVIQRSPVQGLQMPPMTHNTKVVFPYEKEEQEKLVAAFTEQKGNKLRLRYGWGAVLILETGCRAVAALAWNGVDEEKRTLRANKNMVRVDGRTVVQRTTKTASGMRTVPLNSKAMEDIRNLRVSRWPAVLMFSLPRPGNMSATGTC